MNWHFIRETDEGLVPQSLGTLVRASGGAGSHGSEHGAAGEEKKQGKSRRKAKPRETSLEIFCKTVAEKSGLEEEQIPNYMVRALIKRLKEDGRFDYSVPEHLADNAKNRRLTMNAFVELIKNSGCWQEFQEEMWSDKFSLNGLRGTIPRLDELRQEPGVLRDKYLNDKGYREQVKETLLNSLQYKGYIGFQLNGAFTPEGKLGDDFCAKLLSTEQIAIDEFNYKLDFKVEGHRVIGAFVPVCKLDSIVDTKRLTIIESVVTKTKGLDDIRKLELNDAEHAAILGISSFVRVAIRDLERLAGKNPEKVSRYTIDSIKKQLEEAQNCIDSYISNYGLVLPSELRDSINKLMSSIGDYANATGNFQLGKKIVISE